MRVGNNWLSPTICSRVPKEEAVHARKSSEEPGIGGIPVSRRAGIPNPRSRERKSRAEPRVYVLLLTSRLPPSIAGLAGLSGHEPHTRPRGREPVGARPGPAD